MLTINGKYCASNQYLSGGDKVIELIKMTETNPELERKNASKVWKSLTQECLPGRNRDLDYWWRLTGFHLASMVDNANYSTEKQYQALLFHYHMIASSSTFL